MKCHFLLKILILMYCNTRNFQYRIRRANICFFGPEDFKECGCTFFFVKIFLSNHNKVKVWQTVSEFAISLNSFFSKSILPYAIIVVISFFPAVKCNSDPMLLRLMVALGMRFDCASKVRNHFALRGHFNRCPTTACVSIFSKCPSYLSFKSSLHF